MDAVPADRVDEELRALAAAPGRAAPRWRRAGRWAGRGSRRRRPRSRRRPAQMLTPSVPALSSGLTTTGAPPRSAAQATASLASPVFSASAARSPAAPQRLGHRVLVAPRRAQRAAVGGQAEPLAERVGKRHAGLGADDDEGRVVGGEPRRGRLEVASWTTFSTKSPARKARGVEVAAGAGCSARGRPAGRRRRSAAPAAPRSSRRRRRRRRAAARVMPSRRARGGPRAASARRRSRRSARPRGSRPRPPSARGRSASYMRMRESTTSSP